MKKFKVYFWNQCDQCDQMSIVFQLWPFTREKILHNTIKNVPNQAQNFLNKHSKIAKDFLKFCQNGEILSNLATLSGTRITIKFSTNDG